ncbi:MAG TPA: hypothetical protein VIK94_03690 [Bacilli bacterium]
MDYEVVHSVRCKGTLTIFQVRKIQNEKYDVIQDSPARIVYFLQQFDNLKEAIEFAKILAHVFEDGFEQGVMINFK